MPQEDPERKPFFKLFSREWLEGSLRFECNEAERGIFADLLALGNESRQRGVIQANPTTPYPHHWIAAKLNTSLEFFEQCLQKFADQDRISENSDGIHILNFDYYQRLLYAKRGRPKKKPSKPTLADTHLLEQLVTNHQDAFAYSPDSRGMAQLRDLTNVLSGHGCSDQQIHDAFKEAAEMNKLSIGYVRAVLLDWLGINRGD